MRTQLLAFSLLLSSATYATPVEWTLSATFSEGLEATGQFTYDADTNQYTDISIFFDGNLAFQRATSPGFTTPRFLVRDTGVWEPSSGLMYTEDFSLSFEQSLTNAGGEARIASGYYYLGVQDLNECFFGPYCPLGPAYDQTLISGTVSAVPIPAAAWLLGSALIGLRFVRRRNVAS